MKQFDVLCQAGVILSPFHPEKHTHFLEQFMPQHPTTASKNKQNLCYRQMARNGTNWSISGICFSTVHLFLEILHHKLMRKCQFVL